MPLSKPIAISSGNKWFRKSDIILILVLLVLALISFSLYTLTHRNTNGTACLIYYEGSLAQTVDLSIPRIFWLDQNPHVRFEVKDNAIAFIESDCPDKVCVHSGFLSYAGQMAACLPNRVSIQIISGSGYNEVDIIAS